MHILSKKPNKDFVILNLTDTHMDDNRLTEGHFFLEILHRTLDELIERVKPDLITITGDLAWGGHHKGQAHLIAKLDSYGIPWAPVMGNHDHEVSDEGMALYEKMFADSPNCLYEPGDPALGNGNYTIILHNEATGKPIYGMILMDSHCDTTLTNEKGETRNVYAKLWDNQLVWYTEQVQQMQNVGITETAIFQHIPPYAFKEAWKCAFRSDLDPKDMPAPDGRKDCWNPGYENSTGVHYEDVGCYLIEDGVLDVVAGTENTKYIIRLPNIPINEVSLLIYELFGFLRRRRGQRRSPPSFDVFHKEFYRTKGNVQQ